jgi:hypothetical protein
MAYSNIATAAPTVPTRKELDEFFAKVDPPPRGRLILCIDATASRQETWDLAAKLTADMIGTVASIGGLDTQLTYYQGTDKYVASRWFPDARPLVEIMSRVTVRAGPTQIAKALAHARRENIRQKVAAMVLISDACEERDRDLYAEAGECRVPVFLFQEGDDEAVARIYRGIAFRTKGAVAQFDAGAAARLKDLLGAVAAYAAGGVKALANQKSEAAKLLLTQVR